MSTARMALIAVAGVAAGLLFTAIAVAGDGRAVLVTLLLYVVGIAVFSLYRKFSRRSAGPPRGPAPRAVLLSDGSLRGARRRLPPVPSVRQAARRPDRRKRRLGCSGRPGGAGVRLPAARRGRVNPVLLRHGPDPGRVAVAVGPSSGPARRRPQRCGSAEDRLRAGDLQPALRGSVGRSQASLGRGRSG
jgi:hypothetical protein